MSVIHLQKGDTRATLNPGAGAIVESLSIHGIEVLYPDKQVQTPSGMRRRGGIPLLYPNAGAFSPTETLHLEQHGFARKSIWNVEERTESSATLSLCSDENTLRVYPYLFKCILKITVTHSALDYELIIQNNGSISLPVAPGFHPYFLVSNIHKSNVTTSISGLNLKNAVWPETLSFPSSDHITMHIPESGNITLEISPSFKKIMVWSETGMDYLCVEPWTGEVGALHDPHQRLEILAGEKASYTMVIRRDS